MLSVSLSVQLMRQGKIYNIDIYMRDFEGFRQGKGNRI